MTGSTIRNYYKKRLSHGRSIAARAFDFIALRLLFFAAVYCLFFDAMKDRLSALILSLLALALFCIVMAFVNSLRLEHFIKKEQCRLTEEYLRESLALIPYQSFLALAKKAAGKLSEYEEAKPLPRYRGKPCLVCALQTLIPPDQNALLSLYHAARRHKAEEVLLYTAVPVSSEARSFCRRVSEVRFHLLGEEPLLALFKETEPIAADELVEKKLSELAAEKKRKRAQPFAKGQTRRYLLCAAILTAASFLTRFPLYYRLLAGISLALAGIAFFANPPARRKKMPI